MCTDTAQPYRSTVRQMHTYCTGYSRSTILMTGKNTEKIFSILAEQSTSRDFAH